MKDMGERPINGLKDGRVEWRAYKFISVLKTPRLERAKRETTAGDTAQGKERKMKTHFDFFV